MNRSKEALLDYFVIEQLIKDAREEILHPYIENDSNSGGGSYGFNKNKEESKCIRIATDKKINNLKEIKIGVEKVMSEMPGINKEILSLLYQTKNRTKKTYKEVSKITNIDYKYIKNVDVTAQIKVGKILGY